MWTHKTKYKGMIYIGGYEGGRCKGRKFKLKNSKTLKELKNEYTSIFHAKRDGWVLCK